MRRLRVLQRLWAMRKRRPFKQRRVRRWVRRLLALRLDRLRGRWRVRVRVRVLRVQLAMLV